MAPAEDTATPLEDEEFAELEELVAEGGGTVDRRVNLPGERMALSGGPMMVEERWTIDPSTPLPEFNSAGATAFAALDSVDQNANIIALIFDPRIPRREDLLRNLLSDPSERVLSPFHASVLQMPDGTRAPICLMPRPAGGLLFKEGEAPTDLVLRRTIVPQLIQALDDLRKRGYAHRSIRTDTIFWLDADKTQIVLGECFSAPPGIANSPIYETIGRARAIPTGRGEGNHHCDLFALGVALMGIVTGQLPTAPAEGEELAMMRALKGSQIVLTRGNVPPGPSGHLLRGLIQDDVKAQWGLEDLRAWCRAEPPSHRFGDPAEVLGRPVKMGNHSYQTRRALSRALARNPAESVRFLRSEYFRQWSQSGLTEPQSAKRLLHALATDVLTSDGSSDELLLARVRSALEPMAAVKSIGVEIAPDGLGTALAMALSNGEREVIRSIQVGILNGIFNAGLESDATGIVNFNERRGMLTRLIPIARSGDLGQGLERCVYELNPGLACQQSKIIKQYVTQISDILPALDRMIARGEVKKTLVDREIAAFLGARGMDLAEKMDALAKAGTDPAAKALATLKLLEGLQREAGNVAYKNIAGWLADQMGAAAKALKSNTRRTATLKRLGALAETGKLGNLAKGLDLKTLKEEDEAEYKAAVLAFVRDEQQARDMGRPVGFDDKDAKRVGHIGAAFMSYVALIGTVTWLLIKRVL